MRQLEMEIYSRIVPLIGTLEFGGITVRWCLALKCVNSFALVVSLCNRQGVASLL